MDKPEILIVGAGPAGLTAGIYAARSGHKVVVVERGMPGGQLVSTPAVENYPGFAEPVKALELARAMEQQARGFGCEIRTADVTGMTATDGRIGVQTSSAGFEPGALVIATGVRPRELGVPGEAELRGRGISYCAVCDGPFFKNREVAVVGGGDAALDEALYLSNICSRVHLIHRRDQFRGSKISEQRVQEKKNVHLILSGIVTAINGTDKVESIDIKNRKDGAETSLPVAGVFMYVGSTPGTEWCKDAVDLDEHGFVRTDDRLRTNLPGVFAAGDVRTTSLRQVATAVGDGALAAMTAHEHLLESGWSAGP